jgi:hypothetical protein
MKKLKKAKIFALFIITLFSINLYSQDIALVNKIVGNGDAANYYIGHFPVLGSDGLDIHWYGGIRFGDGINNDIMHIRNGRVGIGTYQPTSPLSIGDNHGVKLSIGNLAWANPSIIETGYTEQTGDFTDLKVASYGSSSGIVRILQNGNVGIGTTNPDSKLTVAGNIHAQEVKVTINAGVPDYVFANDYKLKSLQEVENYIKQNSHLPEIPSAPEIEKNGLMLAEMNLMLLKKIEEMTLYMIEMKKEIELLKSDKK